MSLTRRQIEKIDKEPCKEPPFTNFFVGIIKLLSKISPIQKYFNETVGGLSGKIFQYWENKEYEEATKIVLFALKKYRNKKRKILPFMIHHHWWAFVKYGVDSAKYTENSEHRNLLVKYANSGIKPFEGYDIAYSYLEFSRWEYQKKDQENAIKYATLASKADITWAEPDFILGWYSLIFGLGNAEEYLCSAIEKDHRFLFRIVSNDICKQYPHIMNKLKEKFSKVSNEKKS